MRKRGSAPYLLSLPGGVWLALFFVIPMGAMFSMSLQEGSLAEGFRFTGHWQTYPEALGKYDTQLVRSLLYGLIVTAATLADSRTGKVKYFEGTPIPTSIAIVGLLALAFQLGRVDSALWFGVLRVGPAELHPLSLIYVASGSAMISATLRIPKF